MHWAEEGMQWAKKSVQWPKEGVQGQRKVCTGVFLERLPLVSATVTSSESQVAGTAGSCCDICS